MHVFDPAPTLTGKTIQQTVEQAMAQHVLPADSGPRQADVRAASEIQEDGAVEDRGCRNTCALGSEGKEEG